MNRADAASRLAQTRTLLDLIGAGWTTQAIGSAVELGVIDRLAARPRETRELARLTACEPAALGRLLRALASLGIVEERPGGRHALTARGALLREDSPGTVRSWALWSSRYHWPLWADLAGSVRTGRSARERAGAGPGYAHLEGDAQAARTFNLAMAELTRWIGSEVLRVTDWSSRRTVVDVGGGHGELLATILGSQPSMQGVLFDLAHATRGARGHLARAGLAKRARVVTGSFFEAVPPGADAYVLKSILHNWDDARALEILRVCRRAAGTNSRLYLVERVPGERTRTGRRDRSILRSDLNMLVGLGGRERTRREYAALLAHAGFRLARLKATALDYSVIEAVPVGAPGTTREPQR